MSAGEETVRAARTADGGARGADGGADGARVAVHVPAQLRELFGAAPVEHVPPGDVRAAVAALDARFPGLAERVLEPDGRPRRYVHLFVNGRLVADDLAAALAAGDRLWIVPAVAGG